MAEEELGIVFIIVGAVLMVASFFTFLLFVPICALGFILFIVGIILVATQRSRTSIGPYPAYGYPAQPPYMYPPQPPAAGMPTPQAPPPQPLCPVCGSALSWVPQYGRWYCTRCQAYR